MANMGNKMSTLTLNPSCAEESSILKQEIFKLKQELSLKEDTLICLSRENHKLKVSIQQLFDSSKIVDQNLGSP